MTAAKVEASAENGSVRITLQGEIDLSNAATVEDEIREAISHQNSAVLIDLTDLDYIDSSGIRILYRLASRLRTLRIIPEFVVPLESTTRRLIELSGFESIAALRPDRC
jgi:anti-anti-sigma factor